MSEDHTAEAGAHTATAFKALLSAALVLADARRQRHIQQMRRWETEATDRERDAQRRTTTDAALTGAQDRVVQSPVETAQRWADAQQPGTDPGVRAAADQAVREAGVDPDTVRAEHRATTDTPGAVGRGADRTLHPEGVWQEGSEAVKLAGKSFTRTPGSGLTPGLTRRHRTRTPTAAPDRTQDLGR